MKSELDYFHFLLPEIAIRLEEGKTQTEIPEWARALIWLGAWSRQNQIQGRRLITFIVLPARPLAAAFIALGSLVSGARNFKRSFSWDRFIALPFGTIVHWKSGDKNFSGKVLGLKKIDEAEFIELEVIKPASKRLQRATQIISRHHFASFRFSEEKPPSQRKADSYEQAAKLFGRLLGGIDDEWIWTDGAEALLVTSITGFKKAISGISMRAEGGEAINLEVLLCGENNDADEHAKLRITHPKGKLEGDFPLGILDGPEAFYSHPHLFNIPNLVVVLTKWEYSEGIHEIVRQLQDADLPLDPVLQTGIPQVFPAGFEVASYTIENA